MRRIKGLEDGPTPPGVSSPVYLLGTILLRIQINGEPREIEAATIQALVETLGLDPRKVAVERNMEIVPRSLHAATALSDGDRIELVQFVGGG